jgi:hypothetical protein
MEQMLTEGLASRYASRWLVVLPIAERNFRRV